jgi:hypothetical protein
VGQFFELFAQGCVAAANDDRDETWVVGKELEGLADVANPPRT